MAAANTYVPISTNTLGSNSTSITLTAIPSTYTDIIAVFKPIYATANYVNIRVGSGSIDTGTNYSFTNFYGNGTSALTSRGTSTTSWYTTFSGTYDMTVAQIMNYSNTTTYKNMLARVNDGTNGTKALLGLWRNTAAIDQISFISDSTNGLGTGTTLSLYGILAA